VLTAVLFGLAPSSALVIGALLGARWNPPKQATGSCWHLRAARSSRRWFPGMSAPEA
jgi:hypothetical protein